jgi:hypothetical protein
VLACALKLWFGWGFSERQQKHRLPSVVEKMRQQHGEVAVCTELLTMSSMFLDSGLNKMYWTGRMFGNVRVHNVMLEMF